MAGSSGAAFGGGPTPWWQIGNAGGNADNLEKSAPAGYQYDKVQGKYVPIVASATTALDNQNKLMSAIGGVGGAASTSGASAGSGVGTPPITYPGAGGSGGQAPLQQGTGAPLVGAPGGGGGVPDVPHIAHVDTSAAQSADFARAKDQVGLETSGALTGLRSALGGRGMLGSGAESRGTTAVAMKGQGELGDVSRSQAIDAITGQRAEAAANYAGDVSQRGQDVTTRGQDITRDTAANTLASNERSTNYLGQITQRGQDLGAGTAQAALAQEKQMSLLGMLQSAIGGLKAAY